MRETQIRIKTDLREEALESRLNHIDRFLSMRNASCRRDNETRIVEFEFGREGFPCMKVRAQINQEGPSTFLVNLRASESGESLLDFCQRYYRKLPENHFRPLLEGLLKKGAKKHGRNTTNEEKIVALGTS